MNDEMKFAGPEADIKASLENEIDSEAEDTAVRLHELVRTASEEAKLEKLSMPSPKTARLSYSAYSDMRPDNGSIYAPAKTGTYFWLIVLTAIPVIGFIAAAIIAFASKKLAVKRFLTAVLLAQVLVLVIIAALVCVGVFVFKLDLWTWFETITPLLGECIEALK